MLASGWWERLDLAEALAGHDFTTVFRYLRCHGLSNHDIANATGLTASHVDSVVAGLNTVTAYHALAGVCDGLGVPRGAASLAHTGTGPSYVAGEPGPRFVDRQPHPRPSPRHAPGRRHLRRTARRHAAHPS